MITGRIKLAVFAGLLAGSSAVLAWKIEPGIGAGMLYTDNARFEANDEDDDVVALGYVGAAITESDGPFRANIDSSVIYENYIDDTFGDKYNVNLRAMAGWEMVRDRVDWLVQDFFTQQSIDSLDANTPDNRQNTNVFTLGPTITLPISARQRLTFSPQFQDYWYENNDTDNRRYSLNANWAYQVNKYLTTGLGGGITKVAYDDEDKNPNYDSSNLSVNLSGTRPRSTYTASLGTTYVRRDDFENRRSLTGNLAWNYSLTGHSSVRTYLARELRDSSVGLLKSETDPDDGDFSNEQITGDVLRNNIFRLTFRRVDSTFNTEAWTEIRDADYKEAPDDRKVWSFGATVDYQVAPLVTTGASGSYNRTKQEDTGRKDETYVLAANVVYKLSRDLRTRFELQYQNRDSNESGDEYKVFSGFISLVYGFRDLSRPGR